MGRICKKREVVWVTAECGDTAEGMKERKAEGRAKCNSVEGKKEEREGITEDGTYL